MPRRAAVLGTTLLLVLLATLASSVGPHDVLRGDGPDRAEQPESERPPVEGQTEQEEVEPEEPEPSEPGLVWTILLRSLQLATVALAVWALVGLGRRLLRARRRGAARARPEPVYVEFETLDPQRLSDALVRDAPAQRSLLEEGSPRNGIVACWHRFEVQASSIGLAREPWETSSEFTLRLLDAVDADPVAVGDLATLYREARYSDHAVLEPARARAVAALDLLHEDLRRRARSVVGGGR